MAPPPAGDGAADTDQVRRQQRDQMSITSNRTEHALQLAFRRATAGGGVGAQMTEPTVDVRDMLCAQALALVAQAADRLRTGEELRVAYNTEDVRRDLLAWGRQGHHVVQDTGAGWLRVAQAPPQR